MTAREQLAQAAEEFRAADDMVRRWAHDPDVVQLWNARRRFRSGQWWEAVRRFWSEIR